MISPIAAMKRAVRRMLAAVNRLPRDMWNGDESPADDLFEAGGICVTRGNYRKRTP